MRYLSKIIFLNSAHIPMAEIKIDGNTHFAGTQGVGKSTIQRAILFFYNADQMKLGISKEKKSFSEYYFEYPNSYIIYEVTRDGNPYMVVTFINRGRINFRFVDTAFRKEYFMDENNDVYSDWSRIRGKMPAHVNVSPIVDTLEDYRNIIYGNQSAVKPAFRKYAITESGKYRNIPRTIQNVFLNSKLDAEVIKKTIIDSMTDMELNVNIDAMRSLIAEFGKEYDDIMLWEKKNDKGEFYVMKDAKNVVDKYLALLYADSQIREISGKIVFARQRDENVMPELESSQNRLTAEDLRIKRLIQEEKQKYDADNGKILKTLGSLEDKLRSIVSRKEHYREMDIEAIVHLVETEQRVKDSLSRQREILERLTRQHTDITEKYRAIIEKTEQDFKNFQSSQNQKKNVLKGDLLQTKEKLLERKMSRDREIRDKYEEQEVTVNGLIEEYNQELADLNTQKTRIQLSRKYGTEIDNTQSDINTTEDAKEKMMAETRRLKEKEESLLSRWEIVGKGYDEKINSEREEAKKNTNRLKEKIAQEESVLARQDGSLFAWLEENRHGWEDTIGKVADEEILYNTSLHPQTVPDGQQSLFGVSLDLTRVTRRMRTPEEIRKAVRALKDQLESQKKQSEQRIRAIVSEKESAHSSCQKEVRQLRMELNQLNIDISLIPNKLKDLRSKLTDWEKKEDEYKRSCLEENEQEVRRVRHLIQQQKKQLADNKDSRERRLKDIEKEYQSQVRAAEEKYTAVCQSLDEETQKKSAESERLKAVYLVQRDQELSGKGVDTGQVKAVEYGIMQLNKTIEKIDANRRHYYNYLKDKAELFDNESEFRRQKKEQEDKRAQLETRYQSIRDRHQRQKAENDALLTEVKNKILLIGEGRDELEKFKGDDLCPLELKDATAVAQKNDDACRMLVEQLKSAVYNRSNRQSAFKTNVNGFKSYFSSKNTFKFKTDLSTNEDYMAFADNLRDFLDNHLVETYRERLSRHYSDILQRISKEMGDLMRYGSDIEKTINDINRDFDESNFAGVIKKISLKTVESTDRLMQLLTRIKKFCDENSFNLGEINIFSDDKDRTATSKKIVELLFELQKAIGNNPSKSKITLDDTFKLQFRIQENDNDTGWVEKISNVGSDGTDVLVKAMVNIMLVNVFKKKMSRRFNDYRLHCMMDEIGKLHPANVKGILDFANRRNIFLINSSPISYTASDYRYNYILEKDGQSNTRVKFLMSKR